MKHNIQKKCCKTMTAVLAVSVILSVVMPVGNMGWAVNPLDLSIPVKELTPAVVDFSKATVIESSDKGVQITANSRFSDLSGNPYKASVSRMAALGVLHNESNGKSKSFGPNQQITGYEALNYLVNMAGRYNAVQARIAPQVGGMNADRKILLTNQEYLAEAKALNLITTEEEQYLKTTVPRETFAMWLSRAAALTPSTGNLETVSALKDGTSISPNNKTMMETIISEGILVPDKSGNFRPKSAITKGEALSAMDNSLAKATAISAALGLKSDFGLIIGKNVKVDRTGATTTVITDWILRKSDATIAKLRTTIEKPSGKRTDFALYKNNTISASSSLAVGDEIEYYTENNKTTLVRKLDANTLMAKTSEEIKKTKGLAYSFGVVGVKKTERQWTGDGYLLTTRLRVQNYDGEVVDFIVQNKQTKELLNDVLVTKKGKVGGIETLVKGDKIEYLVKGESEIVYVLPKNYSAVTYKGNIKSLVQDQATGATTLTIYDYNNQLQQLPLATYAAIRYGKGFAKVKDLLQNQEVTAVVMNGYITLLTVTDQNENGGYIPENRKMRMGTVVTATEDGFKDQYLQVALDTGEEVRLPIKADTQILKDGKAMKFAGIKEGDPIKLYFSDTTSETPSKVEIETVPTLLKQVYRGELTDVDLNTKTIFLSNVAYLKNTTWNKESTYKKELNLKPETEIYFNNNPITPEELYKNHRGDTLYIAVQDSFGSETGTKINIKKGGEQTYYDRIATLDQVQKVMELKNSTNIGLSDGTIVLKDGRLIPRKNLNLLDNVLVVASMGSGHGNSANIINVVTKADKVFSKLVIGTIDTVNPGSLTLEYYTTLQSDNSWQPIMMDSNTKNYFFNNDSVILDLTAGKQITPTDLFHGKYGKTENEETPRVGLLSKHYYVYMVLDDNDQVVAMDLRKKGLLDKVFIDDLSSTYSILRTKLSDTVNGLIFSKGLFDSVDTNLVRMKMTASYDWSAAKTQWLSNSKDTYFNYTNAIFIKDEKVISYKDLQANDTLYVVRSIENALVVYVESSQ